MTKDHAQNKIADIQLLRGIAILLVLLFHISLTPTILARFPGKITMPFYLGVDIFFIVSGYVVALSLGKDNYNGWRFFVRRIFRLLPAILVFLAVTLALNALFRRLEWQPGIQAKVLAMFSVSESEFFYQAMAILLAFFNFLPTASYVNGGMWSLSVEDQFYGAVTILCLGVGLLRSRSTTAVRWCLLLVSATLVLSLFLYRLAILVSPQRAMTMPSILSYLVVWRFDFLAFGIVLAMAQERFGPWFRHTFEKTGLFLSGGLLLVPLGLAALCETQYAGLSEKRFQIGLMYPVALLCFGMLVWLAANHLAFPATRGPIHRVMLYLGERSYTIYLFHFFALAVTWLIINFCVVGPYLRYYALFQAAIFPIVLFPCVELVYRFVELPMIRYGKHLTSVARRDTSFPVSHFANDAVEVGDQKRAA